MVQQRFPLYIILMGQSKTVSTQYVSKVSFALAYHSYILSILSYLMAHTSSCACLTEAVSFIHNCSHFVYDFMYKDLDSTF